MLKNMDVRWLLLAIALLLAGILMQNALRDFGVTGCGVDRRTPCSVDDAGTLCGDDAYRPCFVTIVTQ